MSGQGGWEGEKKVCQKKGKRWVERKVGGTVKERGGRADSIKNRGKIMIGGVNWIQSERIGGKGKLWKNRNSQKKCNQCRKKETQTIGNSVHRAKESSHNFSCPKNATSGPGATKCARCCFTPRRHQRGLCHVFYSLTRTTISLILKKKTKSWCPLLEWSIVIQRN